jgi:L-fuculose-phosphate aldolase
MPPFTSAYALRYNIITPKDYFGYKELKNISVYDPKNFDDWYERASSEISKYFATNKTNIMVIKGYGVYAFNRDISQMAKELAILEKSCRLLLQENKTNNDYEF